MITTTVAPARRREQLVCMESKHLFLQNSSGRHARSANTGIVARRMLPSSVAIVYGCYGTARPPPQPYPLIECVFACGFAFVLSPSISQTPNSAQLWNNIGMCFFGKVRATGLTLKR